MIDADRQSYRRQFEAAMRHLPRGHVIHHATWRDGQLSTMSHKPERQPREEAEPGPRVKRGAVQQQGLFD